MIDCDCSIAAEDAKIGDFHMRRGLFGGAGPMYRLPRIVGERRAKELMLTGKLLSGREAYEWGLVNKCVPAGELSAARAPRFGQGADPRDPRPLGRRQPPQLLRQHLDADRPGVARRGERVEE